MNKQPKLTSKVDKNGDYVFENVNELLLWVIEKNKQIKLGMHAAGVKEGLCPFCQPDGNCGREWCPYTGDKK
jgi:hypothetical protein